MMMKRTICYPICLLAALIVLAGCQLGKHYTRPDLDLPATLGSQTADDSASLALGRTLHRHSATGAYPQDVGI